MKESFTFVAVIKSFRLSVTILCGLLVHVGYAVSKIPTNWWIVLIVFLIACVTMLQNDYFDRSNDVKKGKRLAYDNSSDFIILLLVSWSAILSLIGVLYIFNAITSMQVGLIFVGIIIGIFYSFSRTILYLPLIISAGATASILLFACMEKYSLESIIVSISVFFVIAGREIIKDYEDRFPDVNYKKTIFTEEKMTIENGLKLAGVLIFVSTVGAIYFAGNYSINTLLFLLFFLSCMCFGTSGWMLIDKNNTYIVKMAKNMLDIAIMVFVITISLLPLF